MSASCFVMTTTLEDSEAIISFVYLCNSSHS